jgi:hypothetical protein
MMFKGFRRGKEFPSHCFCKENKNTKKVLEQCFGAGRGSIIRRLLQAVLEPKPLFLLKLCNKDGKCRYRHKAVEGDHKRMEKALSQENALPIEMSEDGDKEKFLQLVVMSVERNTFQRRKVVGITATVKE